MALEDVTYWAYQIQDTREPGAVDALSAVDVAGPA
jgi:hypothetical protein